MKNSRFLVTGASGFIGHALCHRLLTEGVQIVAPFRKNTSSPIHTAQGSAVTIEVGDIGCATNWSAALQGVKVVFHLAARVHVMHDTATGPLAEFQRVNTAGTEHLARSAVANGVQRLVYVSSIKVNGDETHEGQKFSDETHEGQKFSDGITAMPLDPYAISKWEAEQALHRVAQETGLEVVILRPPLVYGPHVKGNFVHLLRVVSQGVPLPLAAVHNLRSLLYVENLVDALITCATHPAASGQTYLVSDGEDISTPDLLRRLTTAMGVAPRLFACPSALLQWAARLTGKSEQLARLLGSLQVDSGKIRRDLNWRPPYTLQQGFQATADWYRHTSL